MLASPSPSESTVAESAGSEWVSRKEANGCWMTRVKDLLAVAVVLSVTSAVKVKVPAVSGVPLRIPPLVRASPMGAEPLEIVQV